MSNKYAFNCIGDIWQSGGGATVMRGILSNLPKNKNRIIFVSKNVKIPDDISFKSEIVYLNTPQSRLKLELFNQFVMPFILHKYKIKRLVCLDSIIPICYCGKKDLFYQDRMFHFVQLDTLSKKLKTKLGILSLKKANSVYVASKDHKNDICKHLNGISEKIKVVYLGYELNTEDSGPNAIESPQAPYFLFVSVIRPYKNLHGLLESYAKLYQRHGEKIPNLYIIGGYPSGYQGIDEYKDSIMKIIDNNSLQNKVIFKGKQKFAIVEKYLKNTQCFIFPSLFEGFGLPVLEAMANKVPVISSNVHSMPEVGGDTITYFNPDDKDALFDKMEDIYLNGYSSELLQQAYDRSEKFQWKKTALAVDQDREFIF